MESDNMRITVRFNQSERQEFINWIKSEYPAVDIDETVDHNWIDENSNISVSELWTTYCES